jgi:hypothetical protein
MSQESPITVSRLFELRCIENMDFSQKQLLRVTHDLGTRRIRPRMDGSNLETICDAYTDNIALLAGTIRILTLNF